MDTRWMDAERGITANPSGFSIFIHEGHADGDPRHGVGKPGDLRLGAIRHGNPCQFLGRGVETACLNRFGLTRIGSSRSGASFPGEAWD